MGKKSTEIEHTPRNEGQEDSNRVREVTPPGQPLEDPRSDDIPVPPPPNAPAVRCGFYIALQEDGKLRFDIIGTEQHIVDLLGLHQVAGERIKLLFDSRMGGKISLVLGKLQEVLDRLPGPKPQDPVGRGPG